MDQTAFDELPQLHRVMAGWRIGNTLLILRPVRTREGRLWELIAQGQAASPKRWLAAQGLEGVRFERRADAFRAATACLAAQPLAAEQSYAIRRDPDGTYRTSNPRWKISRSSHSDGWEADYSGTRLAVQARSLADLGLQMALRVPPSRP